MIFLQHKKHLLLGSSSIGGDLRRLQLRAEATSILQFSPPHSIARKTTLSPSRLCTQDVEEEGEGGRICFFRASSSFLNAYPGPSFARVENFQEAKEEGGEEGEQIGWRGGGKR